ncbi:MAG TPA: septum formation initiator family protein [Acetobacteraceae bacterium]|nr:septum formation initiator family protein [Acetobacteraceae bacterium]
MAEWKKRMRETVAPLVFLALTGYFVLNAIEGPHGLLAYAKDQKALAAARLQLTQVTGVRDRWETEVAALRTDHLDADSLDERARAMLNLVNPDDIVVMYPPGQKLF